jgi:hypothetical protein
MLYPVGFGGHPEHIAPLFRSYCRSLLNKIAFGQSRSWQFSDSCVKLVFGVRDRLIRFSEADIQRLGRVECPLRQRGGAQKAAERAILAVAEDHGRA